MRQHLISRLFFVTLYFSPLNFADEEVTPSKEPRMKSSSNSETKEEKTGEAEEMKKIFDTKALESAPVYPADGKSKLGLKNQMKDGGTQKVTNPCLGPNPPKWC